MAETGSNNDPAPKPLRIDELDRRILECLREDGRMANAVIARRLGVGQTTVQRRITRLKGRADLKVVPVIEPDAVDLNDCIYVRVKVEPKQLEAVTDAIRTMPEVRYLAVTAGVWDLLVEAFVGSRAHMADFLIRSVGSLEGVTATETFSVLRIAKFGYEWEVPHYHDGLPAREVSNAHPDREMRRGGG